MSAQHIAERLPGNLRGLWVAGPAAILLGAPWRDLRFDMRHLDDPGRSAVVGETAPEEWGTAPSAPFARAGMRVCPAEWKAEAEARLRDGPTDPDRAG